MSMTAAPTFFLNPRLFKWRVLLWLELLELATRMACKLVETSGFELLVLHIQSSCAR